MRDFLMDLQLFADGGEGGILSGDDGGTEDKGGEGGLLSGSDNADGGSDGGEGDKGTDDKGEGNKGADGGSDEDKGEENKPDKPEGAPEKYEAFKVPEGVTIDETAATEFGALAKELNLTQENAQKLVDYQIKFQQAQNAKLDAIAKLAACGFDNHKAFIGFFATVGKTLKEDKFETGKGKGGQVKSAASIIYPEMN